MAQEAIRVIEKVAPERDYFEIVIGRLRDPVFVELEQPRSRERHQHRRVRCEKELRALRDRFHHRVRQRELTVEGQCRLGLVEHEQRRLAEPGSSHLEKRFAV